MKKSITLLAIIMLFATNAFCQSASQDSCKYRPATFVFDRYWEICYFNAQSLPMLLKEKGVNDELYATAYVQDVIPPCVVEDITVPDDTTHFHHNFTCAVLLESGSKVDTLGLEYWNIDYYYHNGTIIKDREYVCYIYSILCKIDEQFKETYDPKHHYVFDD